jgi:predicted metalloprotease with PDZ domain
MNLLSGHLIKSLKLFPCCLSLVLLCTVAQGAEPQAKNTYQLDYLVKFVPEREGASVQISIDNGALLRKMIFDNSDGIYSDIHANGKLTIKSKKVTWELPAKDAQLTYFVKLTHERSTGKFDSRVTKDWALFRGDDLIPAAETFELSGAHAVAKLEFILPEGWPSVETGWPRQKGNVFIIDNPERLFDRPTGWMIAGKMGTRRATIKKTSIAVSAPAGEGMRRMDALTFFNFVWPEANSAFNVAPKIILVVGADDPMWRGGLSAPNSLFLHSDRPLVSENGTSPLLHELTHILTRIRGATTAKTNDDWIAEGLAEFYSFELLYRADGMTKARRSKIIKNLADWGSEVEHLRASKSTGPVTARAVVLIDELDKEIRKRSNNKHNIDDVTQQLMVTRKVSLNDLRKAVEKLIGPKIDTLNSPLLK